MSEPTDLPGDERAAAAFRDAFGRPTPEFAPLDPADLALQARIRRRAAPDVPVSPDAPDAPDAAGPGAPVPRRLAGRRRPLRALLVAAAVVVVAAPVGWLALGRSFSGPVLSAAPAAPADADAAEGAGKADGAAAGGQQAPRTSASASGFGAPPAGHRWESFLDVVVAVPEAWGYAQAPGSDWCAAGGPTPAPLPAPYVTLNPNRPVLAIGCLGDIPEDRQQTHLEWRRAASGDGDGDVTRNGWVYSSRRVGSALVTVVHRPGDDAGAILASARQVAVTHHGCAVTGPPLSARPAPAASGMPAGGITAVLCQYDDPTESPNLVTSTRLTGAAASGLAAAIADSPAAGPALGPDCLPSDRDVTRVVVRLDGAGASREVWLTLGGCRVPSLDDGVVTRTPTRAACTAVFTPPLARWVWDASSARLCGPVG